MSVSDVSRSVQSWVSSTHRSYSQLTFFIFLLECLRKYVLKIYFFKNYPEGNICGTFFKKGQKCTLSKAGFDQKLHEILSLFHWPTTHREFVRGRTPLQRPIVPQTGRAKQDKHRCLYSSSTSNERTEDREGSTLSMTHTRNIRDDVQQAGDPSVAALCVRDQGFSDCCKL